MGKLDAQRLPAAMDQTNENPVLPALEGQPVPGIAGTSRLVDPRNWLPFERGQDRVFVRLVHCRG